MAKVLSLYQPWAQLVVIGAKKFETRSWATSYRGLILIHASKRFTKRDWMMCHRWPFRDALSDVATFNGEYQPHRLPVGVIIGCVKLIDCPSTSDWLRMRLRNYGRTNFLVESGEDGDLFLTSEDYREYRFGDYNDGRRAWELQDPVHFEKPIPAKGSLGLWELPESALGHLVEK